ncbi:MAG: hypothetical protein LBM98_04730 [Oscillospiraceae bacterium]|nr:hypothetical protein [Oscillospiraceae bacterium]
MLRIASVPRLAMTGWGYAPPLVRGAGTKEGAGTGEGGFETRPYVHPQPPSKPTSSSPLWRGIPAGAGWFPPRGNPRLNYRL